MTTLTLYELYEKMYAEMGPQGWWPADSKIEIIVGAILVQNTNWNNVGKSLANIKKATSFDANKIAGLDRDELIEFIRPSGFYKNKSKAILGVFQWLSDHNYDFKQIKQQYGENLRKELLNLHGVGDETADVLLLYVFDVSVFIADNYARKLFAALGQPLFKNYRELKKRIKNFEQFTLEEAQEFHGLIDEFGKISLKNEHDFQSSFLADYSLTLN